MKKIMLQALFILIVLFMFAPHGMADPEPNDLNGTTWQFFNPAEWDLAYEDAVELVHEWLGELDLLGELDFFDDSFQVGGLFRYLVDRWGGEYDRGWYIVFRKNGSPYYHWTYFVSSPDGNVSHFHSPDIEENYYSDRSVSDIEAIDATFRKMIETDYISLPNVSENTILLSYVIDAASNPMDYIYEWIFGDCRWVPVMAVFSDENETYEKKFYVEMCVNDYRNVYELFLYSEDDLKYWYMGIPRFDQHISYATVGYTPMEIIEE